MDAPAPVAAWRDPNDPRDAITIDNLPRMNSGIEFGQSLYSDWRSAFDPSAQMQFDMADEAAFAETAELGAPGTLELHQRQHLAARAHDPLPGPAATPPRSYASSSRAVRQARHGACHARIRRCGHADRVEPSTRDWARFGQLYLR